MHLSLIARGRVLILKAELRLNQGREMDAYHILKDAIEISQNPRTRFLQKKLATLVQTAFPEMLVRTDQI